MGIGKKCQVRFPSELGQIFAQEIKMSTSGNICATVFLVVSMLFILVVHINGFVYQVPEEPYFAFLFVPIPLLFTLGSIAWLWSTYQGAEVGGYPIKIEDVMKKQGIVSDTKSSTSTSSDETVTVTEIGTKEE